MTIRATEQVLSADPVVLDAGILAPFEIGARLEALLCQPSKSPAERLLIADAVCADIVLQRIEEAPADAAALRARFPRYLKSKSRASLGSQARRWEQGFVAGAFFLRQMKPTALRELGFAEAAGDPMSGRQIAQIMWPADEEGYEEDYESRLNDTLRHSIRKYHPVAHLAAAYQYLARIAAGEGMAATFDYEDVDFHRLVVGLAERFAGYIRRTPGMTGIAIKLIDIEWRN